MALIIGTFLVLGCIYFWTLFIADIRHHWHSVNQPGKWITAGIGFIANFLDSLGIGSFAVATLGLKMTRSLKNDRLLPGTLNVSCTAAVLLEATLFAKTIKVNGGTLISMVLAAVIGASIGSRIIARFNERHIRIIMGIALLATAGLMTLQITGVMATLGQGNTATGLTGGRLLLGIGGNFILGALMTAGIGLYAPCMALTYLLGLTPACAFPIMMTSCALLQPVASREFIKNEDYDRKASFWIALGAIPGVIIAVTLFKNLNTRLLTWLVIGILIYTAGMMLYRGIRPAPSH